MKPDRRTQVVVWGAAGNAKVVSECLSHYNCRIAALFDNNPPAVSPLAGVPLFIGQDGFVSWHAQHKQEAFGFVLAIGGDRGLDRLVLHTLLKAHGLEPLSLVHPTAFVAGDVQQGKGCQILARATVCTEVRLGDQTIINTSASVDHECLLGDGVHIGPGAILTGCVNVGDRTFIGAGAVVLPRLHVGTNVVVGAGAVVTRNVPDNAVVWGNPARVMRFRPDYPYEKAEEQTINSDVAVVRSVIGPSVQASVPSFSETPKR